MSWWHKLSTGSLALLSAIWFWTHQTTMAIVVGAAALVALGEWINHPNTRDLCTANRFGLLLEIAGTTLMFYGAYRAFIRI